MIKFLTPRIKNVSPVDLIKETTGVMVGRFAPEKSESCDLDSEGTSSTPYTALPA